LNKLFSSHFILSFFILCLLVSQPAKSALPSFSNDVNIVLVDQFLQEQTLLQQATDISAHYILFNSSTDPLEGIINNITDWATHNDQTIASISILSHGKEGLFQLGNEHVTTVNVLKNASLWKKLAGALNKNARIFIYGCNVGRGINGKKLVETLSSILHANIFASANLTGSGGDWELEVASNSSLQQSAPHSPINTHRLNGYKGTLADTGYKYPISDGTGWTNPDRVSADDGLKTHAGWFNTQKFKDLAFGLPTSANINGIELQTEGNAVSLVLGGSNVTFSFSWDGGVTWSDTKQGNWLCLIVCITSTETLGSSTDTWGRTWNYDDFSDTNFRIRAAAGGIGIGADTQLDYIRVKVNYSPLSTINSTISVSDVSVTADGISTSTITIQTKDDTNTNLITGGQTIVLSENGDATISAVTDNNDGTYTATITNTTAEVITISGSISAVTIGDDATVTFTPSAASTAQTTISASPTLVTADGIDVSLLTIQTVDTFGNPLTIGGDTIVLSDNNDATLSPVTDQLNGTYTATVNNPTVQVTLITGTLNGTTIIDDESISFVPGGPAQINASDGNFINGFGPLGSTVVVQDEFGNTLCNSATDSVTGKYHCLITDSISNGQELTVIATDLANNSETSTITVQSTDDDDDGISNLVETLIADIRGASNAGPDTDSDGDGLPDYSEIFLGSDLLSIDSPSFAGNSDSDMDGITDAVENYFNTAGGAVDSRLSTDTDGDGIPDITELVTRKSDFNHTDLPLINGTADSDGDGVTDAVEFYLSTFLIINIDDTTDYDHDGYSDAIEVRLASDPLRAYSDDIDMDGVNNSIESYLSGTINDGIDSLLLDRDNDDLPDIYEIELSKSLSDPSALINDANNGDTDGDGLSDGVELYLSGDSTSIVPNQDIDGDGVTSEAELASGSNPFAQSTPVIWIDVADLGGGSVELFVRLGGFQAPYPDFIWDTSDIVNKEPSANIGNINNQQLTVTGLSVNTYSVGVNLTKTIDGLVLSSTTAQRFTVTDTGVTDNDYDGISDSYDTFDAMMGAEENLHSAIGFSDEYQIQLQYGSYIRAGSIARMGKNEISTISFAQLSDFANSQLPIEQGSTEANNDITSTANLFDIEITNIPSAGDSIDVVLPLNKPLASDAAVLWFNHSNYSWSFFDTTTSDIVSSAAGSPGNCPPVDDSSYGNELTPGSYCLKLKVTDGGNNDQDSSANGVIPLLMGIGNSNYLPSGTGLNDSVDNNINPEPAEEDNNTSSGGSSGGGGGGSLSPMTLILLLLVYLSTANKAVANPENGSITVGSGSIIDTPSLTTVIQDTDRMAIEWDSFDIANGESVIFVQPDSSSIVLNQDFSGSPSQLFGNLNANGQVILLNNAGILMGETASINVGSFFASDLSVDTDDYANGSFTLSDLNPLTGGVTNLGNIQSFGQSGIYITGQYITNEGNMTSSNGDINLTIADQVIVSTDPSGLIGVELAKPIIDNISPSMALISNEGNIIALNGNIYIDLYYSDAIKADTVNNTGIINAVAISGGTGNIELTATPVFVGPSDTTLVDGIISESLPYDTEPTTPTVEFELSPSPKVSINSIMPDCDKNDGKIKDCNKYQAIKRYLSRLLLGGQLPDPKNQNE